MEKVVSYSVKARFDYPKLSNFEFKEEEGQILQFIEKENEILKLKLQNRI